MRSNYYAIVPIEFFSRRTTDDTRERAAALLEEDAQGLFSGNLFGRSTAGISVYAVAKQHNVEGVAPFDIHLAFVQTSACFVFHRATEITPDVATNEQLRTVRSLLDERRALHEHLLRSPRSIITSTLDLLATDGTHDPHSYVFSFFVFEGMSPDQFIRWDARLKLLAEPSRVGLEADGQGGAVDGSIDTGAIESTPYDITDVDISVHSCAYVTWASIAAASWGSPDQASRTKDMILSLEITLQAAWNKSDALSRRIDAAINEEAGDVDAEGLLLGFSQALEVIRGVVSPTIPTRDQSFFDALRLTSRIDEKIDVVDRKLDLMERYVERRRELSRRRLSQFARIALYVIGSADVLGTVLSLFVGDAELAWRFIWFGVAFALAITLGLAFWLWSRWSERSRSAGWY